MSMAEVLQRVLFALQTIEMPATRRNVEQMLYIQQVLEGLQKRLAALDELTKGGDDGGQSESNGQ